MSSLLSHNVLERPVPFCGDFLHEYSVDTDEVMKQ